MKRYQKGRQYQDTIFRAYFNDAERLKEIAGALHGRVYDTGEPLEIVTLEGTFLSQVKNDISFLLAGHNLIFLEHQSTKNQNMALRCLYYVCEQLRTYIPTKNLYQNAPIRIPVPEFHVFYTGRSDMPEADQMKLSDAYMKPRKEIHLELKVNFHNIAYDNRKMILQKSRALHDYSFFMDCIKRNIATGMERAQAIREAMQYCEGHDIMKIFLQQHKGEVIDMVNFEWNQKDFEEAIMEEGIERGREEGKVSVVLGMLKEKLPLETIAKVSEISLDKIREIGKMHSLL